MFGLRRSGDVTNSTLTLKFRLVRQMTIKFICWQSGYILNVITCRFDVFHVTELVLAKYFGYFSLVLEWIRLSQDVIKVCAQKIEKLKTL